LRRGSPQPARSHYPPGRTGRPRRATTSVGAVISGSRSRQRGVQSSFENTALSRPVRADAGCGPQQRSRTPAAWARASAASNCAEPENTRAAAHRTVQDRRAVGPVDRCSAAEVGHDRRGVPGQVVVDGTRRDRAGAGQHERGDPRRVVQRQELCDETAGRDAHDVRAGDAEPVEYTDRVGHEVVQRVAGRVGVGCGRPAGVPQVVADDELAGEPLDELVVPGGDSAPISSSGMSVGEPTVSTHSSTSPTGRRVSLPTRPREMAELIG